MTHVRARSFALLSLAATMLTALASVTAQAAGSASEAVAVTLRDRALNGDTVAWEIVSELTTRFGPRPAGSASEKAAAEWCARTLERLGFTNVRIEPFPMTAWVRGTERVEITAPWPQPIVASALGGSPPTPLNGVEAEIVYFETLAALKAAAPGSLTGRIAMVGQPMPRTQNGSGYGATGAIRRDGPGEAARRGAVGYVHRSLATGGDRFAHAGASRYEGARVPIPSFALSEPDAEQIERLLKLGEKVRVRLVSSASYVSDATSQNVMGEIRGTDKPEEVVLLAAHLDSWDQGTGAIDDAAGVAIITAAAKLIAEAPRKPRRTIRVVFYGSEEVSQPGNTPLGAQTYPARRRAEIDSHIIAGESDFGADRVYSVSLPAGAHNSAFGEQLARVLAPISVAPSSDSPGSGGADIAPLAELGVPVFRLDQDGTRYFDLHHTANDTLDKIDPAALAQNVAAWVSLVWLVADSDVDFRALRSGAGTATATR